MAYFADSNAELRLPLGDPRLREARLAAIQAVGTHFFNSDGRAIVAMLTGSGKIAVLATVDFMLRAKRVLVLTPSLAGIGLPAP